MDIYAKFMSVPLRLALFDLVRKCTVLSIMVTIGFTTASVQIDKQIRLSSKRAHFSTIQAEDRIFFVGGFENHDYIASSVIDIYNLTSGSWEKPINLPSPRARIATAVLEPYIYMAGGYTNDPIIWKLNTETQSFTSAGFTAGPTVRATVRAALYNNTVTLVGRFSVDFWDLSTKNWTHNENLTSVMSPLFDTTTLPIRNSVFIMGGFNATTLDPSTSIYLFNSASALPIVWRDMFPADTTNFIRSWVDEAHNVDVIVFQNRCFVYHHQSQQWFQREASNNTIATLSFLNSTLVFFSDGFWTLDWNSLNNAWSSLDQVGFAFTNANELVYYASNKLYVVTSNTTTVTQFETGTFGTPLLDVVMSASIRVFVNSSGAVFMYSSSSKQLVLVKTAVDVGFTAQAMFRVNDTMVYIIGINIDNRYWIYTINSNQQMTSFSQIPFIPDVLIQNYFYNIAAGQNVPVTSPLARSFTENFVNPVLARQEDVLYVFPQNVEYSISSVTYPAIDVYNYVLNQWESSIPFNYKLFAGKSDYLPTAILDDSLSLIAQSVPGNPTLFRLNTSSLFYNTKLTNNANHGPGSPNHPTHTASIVMNNDTMYSIDAFAGIFVTSLTGAVVFNSPEVIGNPQQAISKGSKVILSLIYNSAYTSIVIYDIDTSLWRGSTFPNSAQMVSIITYDNYLLVLGDNTTSINYFDLTTEEWFSLPFSNGIIPASMFTLPPSTGNTSISSSHTTLVIAGGYHRVTGQFTDEVRFVSFDLTPVTPQAPITVAEPITDNIASPNAEDNSTIIIAIVIPVAVFVIAAILLTVLLLRRRRQQKRSMAISMTGLEQQQFGQWFVPYEDIAFGEQLGQGGNGQVFKGKWKNTDVALKVSMAQANQSVVSELSMMIGLRPHPNVVQLFGFSVHPETNSVILILEFCNGGSLDATLYHDNIDIDVDSKLYWLKNVCKGIGHLHSNNIVHRDIAARNILLHQGEPKLTDFGLSRLVDEQQHGTTKSELGPIRWMAPESLREKKYSPKSDVWSFGILMFEVLERQEPHVNEDPISIGMKIRDQGVIPELSQSSQYPSDLISVMRQCCQMSPTARPTIDQVQEKLEAIRL